jgi:hypothetical protein
VVSLVSIGGAPVRVGPFARHGLATLEAVGPDELLVTLTRNFQLAGHFRHAVEAALTDLAAAGLLADAGGFTSAYDDEAPNPA